MHCWKQDITDVLRWRTAVSIGETELHENLCFRKLSARLAPKMPGQTRTTLVLEKGTLLRKKTFIPSKLIQAATLLTSVREVPGSKFDRNTIYACWFRNVVLQRHIVYKTMLYYSYRLHNSWHIYNMLTQVCRSFTQYSQENARIALKTTGQPFPSHYFQYNII
jgi:hypothetical protein